MVILEKNHSHNMTTTVVVCRRNPCSLTVAAFAAATLRAPLLVVGWFAHQPTFTCMAFSINRKS